MNTNPLDIAFIGGSLDSAVGTTHVLSSQLDRRWSLVASCFSHIPEMNRETSAHWGIDPERVHDDWETLLRKERGKVDAVAILTPTPLHADMVGLALDLGYPVICEKSLCTGLEGAKRLWKKVGDTKGFLAVIYNYTGYPMLREMRRRVADGYIGNVTQVHVEMPQEGYLKLDAEDHALVPQDWRLQDPEIPTLHLDLGVHVENILYFLLGRRARQVLSVDSTFGNFRSVVDNTLCIARYPDDILCHIWFSKSALGYSNGLKVRVFGTTGAMEWGQLDPDTLRLHDNHGATRILDPRTSDLLEASNPRYNRFKPGHPNGFIEAFANYYQDLADAVQEHLDPSGQTSHWVFDARDATEGLAMLAAMKRSAEVGHWVDLETIDDPLGGGLEDLPD